MKYEETIAQIQIKNGTVIDHIPNGKALLIIRLLGITGKENHIINVFMHVPSSKMDKKDIVKVENMYLNDKLVRNISLIAPNLTINIIDNYDVKEKKRVELPEKLTGIIKCPNLRCITNDKQETIQSLLYLKNKLTIEYQCGYCDKVLNQNTLIEILN